MIFRVIEVDEGTHWHMMAWTHGPVSDRVFGEWITQHYPNISAVNRFNSGNPYWILKGDNPRDQTLILMKWQDE
jgi:uncharacterized phage-associated protein